MVITTYQHCSLLIFACLSVRRSHVPQYVHRTISQLRVQLFGHFLLPPSVKLTIRHIFHLLLVTTHSYLYSSSIYVRYPSAHYPSARTLFLLIYSPFSPTDHYSPRLVFDVWTVHVTFLRICLFAVLPLSQNVRSYLSRH